MSVLSGSESGAPSQGVSSTPTAVPPPPLLGRVRTRLRRLLSWCHQHPTWADTILAMAVLAGDLVTAELYGRLDEAASPLTSAVTRFPLIALAWLVCTVCLALRRRCPVRAWLVMTLTLLFEDDLLSWLDRLSPGTLAPDMTVDLGGDIFSVLGPPLVLGTVALHSRQLVTWSAFTTTCLLLSLDAMLEGPALEPMVLWLSVTINCLILLVAVLVGLNLRSARARVAEAEIRASRQALAREQSALLAASTERSRIAREMHDVVAHSLAVMITMADGAAATIDRDPATAKQALTMLAESGRTALADTRRLVGVLREDPTLSQPAQELQETQSTRETRHKDSAGAATSSTAPDRAASAASLPEAATASFRPQDGEDCYAKTEAPKDPAGSPSPTVRDLPVPEFAPPGTVATVEPSTRITSLLHEETSSSADSSTGATPLTPAPEQADIVALVNRFQSAGVPVSYTWSGRALPDDKGLQLTVFRITQEALTNILRYAPTSPQVSVVVERHTGAVVLTIDNEAAPGSRPMHGSGKGLIGMRERAAVYGGTVQAGPTSTGWRVRAVLHWEETEEGTSSWQTPM